MYITLSYYIVLILKHALMQIIDMCDKLSKTERQVSAIATSRVLNLRV